MLSLNAFIHATLAHGCAYFSRAQAQLALASKPAALAAALTRLVKKGRLASPRHGFYLILRAEDSVTGAPDPARWIAPLMQHLGVDYRISLLRAAAFHGSAHQAAMVFQVVVPKQQRNITLGRHRVQFVYQAPAAFATCNQSTLLAQLKTDAGYAQVAGVELTLLDCARYASKATGIQGLAQIAKDIGAKAQPRRLAQAAAAYENATLRRLGYLLALAGHARQAQALAPFALRAKTTVPLDPSERPLLAALAAPHEHNTQWKLLVHTPVEIDF